MIKNLPKLALISAISCGFVAQTTPAHAERTITCESYKGRYRYCQVDTRGGVRLIRQISNAECRQGRTWGYDRGGIWVDNGCSAKFALRDLGGRYNHDDDGNGGNAALAIGTAIAVGAIAAALSNQNDGGSSRDNNYATRTISCSSEDGKYHFCSTDINRRSRVRLKRQLSNSGCWEGNTWGYDRNGIWVDRGCRAVFEIRN